jgi:hypothetical protein
MDAQCHKAVRADNNRGDPICGSDISTAVTPACRLRSGLVWSFIHNGAANIPQEFVRKRGFSGFRWSPGSIGCDVLNSFQKTSKTFSDAQIDIGIVSRNCYTPATAADRVK